MQALGSGIARFLLRLWHIFRWPLAILMAAFVIAILYVLLMTPTWSKEAINEINARHLTVKDADGTNLPPMPDKTRVDATVQGVDANGNGIRDEVELAIFKKYPNDTKLRAAALQYAMTEQWFISGKIVDKASWKAAAEADTRAYLCIKTTGQSALSKVAETVESYTFNTTERQTAKNRVYQYTTSNGTEPGAYCDVSIN